MRNWFWNALAEFAFARLEVNAEHERDAETADERAFFAARTDWWHDVASWADGIDTWRSLRGRRRASYRAALPLMPPIEAFEPVRITNPIIFVLAILATLVVISMAMPFLLPRSAHAAEAGAHDPARAAWFASLKQPGTNLSCCDISDCRRTKAEWRGSGWMAEVAMPDGTRRWTPIPVERVVLRPHSIDGEAYLCQSAGNIAGPAYANGIGMVERSASEPVIYCFIPPDMGS